jgi:hypothetical protein
MKGVWGKVLKVDLSNGTCTADSGPLGMPLADAIEVPVVPQLQLRLLPLEYL